MRCVRTGDIGAAGDRVRLGETCAPQMARGTGLTKFNTSEHADGERLGPVPICKYLKTRLTETFLTLPFDSS